MIFAGDKLKLTMNVGGLVAGTIFDVTGVSNEGVIYITHRLGTGCVSVDEIGKIFEKVEKIERTWTEWTWDHNQHGEYRYRHNGKNVQVELWNGVRAAAYCHPDDEFDLKSGVALAFMRASQKYATTVAMEFDRQYAWMFAD